MRSFFKNLEQIDLLLFLYFFRPNLNLTVLDTKQKMLTETSSSGKKTAMPAELRKDPTDTPTLMEFTGLLSTLLTNMDSEHGSKRMNLEQPNRTQQMWK